MSESNAELSGKVMEEICEAVHKAYCQYHLENKGTEYWTKGDYSKLNEEGKEYDRRTVMAVLKALIHRGDLIPKERLMSFEEIIAVLDSNLEIDEAGTDINGFKKAAEILAGKVAVKEEGLLTVEEISKKISGFKVSREIIDNSPQVNWGMEYQQDIDWCVNVVNNQIDRIISSFKGMVQKAMNP